MFFGTSSDTDAMRVLKLTDGRRQTEEKTNFVLKVKIFFILMTSSSSQVEKNILAT